ncbi:pentatricopeptide repeat-containing protein At2g13600-like [Macadamia integrifolia]|uniref:pentatricopeptide repeat-containing protein At2g13600-like n=1 Tax=Macadamia integrifolia TaxID=60698 RepID=UPI001C52AE12|nr:pentatricopeptide repeat-containing protein At2g13600-like [Macadamia integrifolia]
MLKAQAFHASLLKAGLQNHVYRCNLLLQAYSESGALSEANKLLHLMPQPNSVSYNTVLSGYIKSQRIDEAFKLFSATPQPDSRSWNIIISGCIQNQRTEEAMTHFVQMRCSYTRPDDFTFTIVIPCCDVGIGRQIHAEIVKVGWYFDIFVGTNLHRMYADAGEMVNAKKVFDEMPNRDLVSWNALLFSYSKLGMGEISLKMFQQLIREGVQADEFTYAIVLNECASHLRVFEARQVHSLIIRSGFGSDRFTNNSLVNLYSKCGLVASAAGLFEEMTVQDVVAWTAMIVGLSQSGHEEDVMPLFYQMRLAGVKPNSFTFGGILSACASANAFERGRKFHGLAIMFGLDTDVVVGSAIVNMYLKCGEMDDSLKIFRSMPETDIVSWNGMICGYAQNGEGMKALYLFHEMVQSRSIAVVPNHITFIGVLSACSHNGLVNEGRFYFNDMIQRYSIKPTAEHYTCMVDILARAGLLEEAESLILALPFKADSVIWGALLGACRLHGNTKMARRVAERLYVDEPENSSNYVLLANAYTAIGEWNDASEIREVMDATGAQKVIGCSWIEIYNSMHSFVAGDKNHPQIGLVYEVLWQLCQQMEEGYEIMTKNGIDSLIDCQ